MNHSNDDFTSKPYEKIPPLDLENIPLDEQTETTDYDALRIQLFYALYELLANIFYRLADDFLLEVDPHRLGLRNDSRRDHEIVRDAIKNYLCCHYFDMDSSDYYESEIFSIILENLMKRDETLFQMHCLSFEVHAAWVTNTRMPNETTRTSLP